MILNYHYKKIKIQIYSKKNHQEPFFMNQFIFITISDTTLNNIVNCLELL
jgi:hypothetical protein